MSHPFRTLVLVAALGWVCAGCGDSRSPAPEPPTIDGAPVETARVDEPTGAAREGATPTTTAPGETEHSDSAEAGTPPAEKPEVIPVEPAPETGPEPRLVEESEPEPDPEPAPDPEAPPAPAPRPRTDPEPGTGTPTWTPRPLPATNALSDDAFVGPDACKKCHFKQHRYWRKTGLATTLDRLRPTPSDNADLTARKVAAGLDPLRDYTGGRSCMPCHTTGYGAPGGYPTGGSEVVADPERATAMGSVSCEACHGGGERYVVYKQAKLEADKDVKFTREELLANGLVLPSAEACATSCHNDRGPTHATDKFEYERNKTRVHSKR